MDPRPNCGLASALSSMMLTHTSSRPGEPPPPCLGVGDQVRPLSYECDVWLGSMVRTRVRVPVREHRRTNYCPHAGQHDSHVVSQRVGQQNKFTAKEWWPAWGDGCQKMAPNLANQRYEENQSSSEEPKFESRPAPFQHHLPAYLHSPAIISV